MFIPSSSKNDILLIRLDSIGDFILWLDSAKGYRILYPRQKITLLANDAWAGIARKLPYWDEVWELDKRRFYYDPLYRLKNLVKIRKAGFKIVIQPRYSRDFFVEDAIVYVSGAAQKIGFAGDCSNIEKWQKRISDKWYTTLVPASDAPLMELCRNAEFMRGIGLKDFVADVPNLPFDLDIVSFSKSFPEKFYVLFPGAREFFKQWPAQRFGLLAEKIYGETGMVGVICGGASEVKTASVVLANSSARLLNFAGKTTLEQLTGLIKNARFVISNDSVAIHIAVATNTPSVCILGGGHYGRFVPYVVKQQTTKNLPIVVTHKMDCFNCNWTMPCLPRGANNITVPCIAKIKVRQVWEEVKRIINNYNLEEEA